jgi:hypothetical protein
VLRGAIGLETKQITKREEMRIGRSLSALKFKRERRTIDNTRIYVYFLDIALPTSLELAGVGHGEPA